MDFAIIFCSKLKKFLSPGRASFLYILSFYLLQSFELYAICHLEQIDRILMLLNGI